MKGMQEENDAQERQRSLGFHVHVIAARSLSVGRCECNCISKHSSRGAITPPALPCLRQLQTR